MDVLAVHAEGALEIFAMVKNYITKAGFERLKAEYEQLFHVERPKLVETVAWAASNGDRSENADYIYGKRRLREIDRRLGFLSDRLEKSMVVDPTTVKTERVVFGASVVVEDENGIRSTYMIVGEDETEPARGRISWKSPIAKGLLNKQVDEEVTVQVPSGEKIFTILEIGPGSE
jgi:transcription elongation factor GreB